MRVRRFFTTFLSLSCSGKLASTNSTFSCPPLDGKVTSEAVLEAIRYGMVADASGGRSFKVLFRQSLLRRWLAPGVALEAAHRPR